MNFLFAAPFSLSLHTCGVMWCIRLSFGVSTMSKTAQKKMSSKTVRTSVSLPHDLHDTLARLAKDKKVSVSWVIRDAAEKYVNEQWPLLAERLV